MLISVVIPTLYPKKNVEALLEGLTHSVLSPLHKLEVLVVANFSKDKRYLEKIALRYKGAFKRLEVLCSGVKSANIARNLGVRKSRGEIIFFIDDDCTVDDPNYLENMVTYMMINPDVDGLGGGYSFDETYSQRRIDRKYADISKFWLQESTFSSRGETHSLIGGNCCYRRCLFEQGFSFDPLLAFGGTESSLNSQLTHWKKKLVYRPEFAVTHRFKLSHYQFIRKAYLQGKGKAHNFIHNDLKRVSRPILKDNNEKRDFYAFLYDYFFQLGFNSKREKNPGYVYKILRENIEFIFFPPIIQKYTFKIRHVFVMTGLFLYHRIYRIMLHKIYYKIYFMSEYHWRVYIRPIFYYLKKIFK
ncbi:MAG: glycosyltransferase [Bacteriovoracaceae bacterium]|nr:glycosyltransferase [Bacteriovoracaceae bacterium]